MYKHVFKALDAELSQKDWQIQAERNTVAALEKENAMLRDAAAAQEDKYKEVLAENVKQMEEICTLKEDEVFLREKIGALRTSYSRAIDMCKESGMHKVAAYMEETWKEFGGK